MDAEPMDIGTMTTLFLSSRHKGLKNCDIIAIPEILTLIKSSKFVLSLSEFQADTPRGEMRIFTTHKFGSQRSRSDILGAC